MSNFRLSNTISFFRSLRIKVIAQMLAISLIPIFILAALVLMSFQNTIAQTGKQLEETRITTENTVGKDMSNRAHQIARRIDTFMLTYIEEVQLWASSPTFIEGAKQATLDAGKMGFPLQVITSVEEIKTVEDAMSSNRRLNTSSQINDYLNFLVEQTAFAEVFFTEKFGYNVAFSNPTSDFVQSDEEWWTSAWNDGLHLGEPEYDDSAGTYVIPISMRIDDPLSGASLGVIKAVLDIGGLQTLADEEAALYNQGHVTIFVVENGYRLADTRVNHDMKLMLSEEGKLSDYLPAQSITTLQDSESAYLTTEDTVIGYARTDGQFAWGVSIEQPKEVVFSLVNNLDLVHQELENRQSSTVQLVTIVTTLTVLITSGMAVFQTNLIVNPIARLQRTAQQLSTGDLSIRSTVHSKDEIGTLANAFNDMADNLESMMMNERESRGELESTIAEYMRFVDHVANGDLRSRLEVDATQAVSNDVYRLGLNLNQMVDGLYEMAQQIGQASSSVAAAVSEIQASATQQSSSVIEQNATITQTAAIVEEVRTTVQETAKRAQSVAATARESVDISSAGESAVSDSVSGMSTVRGRVEDIATNILELSQRTQQIGDIIEAVNALADQSKLLALNASIEAARAGDEGKGFAIVAMEVRQLAEQSREATARVQGILGEIQQATNSAVMVTEEGSKGAEQGMKLVEHAGSAIRDLAASIEEAAQSAIQIAASTQQQLNGIDQLATAIAQIQQAASQTAQSTKQTELSIHDLMEMAQELDRAASRYQL